jgi:hypothetical protein
MNKAICLFVFKSPLVKNGIIEKEEDNYYIDLAIKNVKTYKSYPVDILVLTDSPEEFKDLNVIIVPYTEVDKSYTDKLLVCEIALKKYETILYVDSDITLNIDNFCEAKFNPGIYYTEDWLETPLTYQEFKNIIKDDYFDHIENHCKKNNLKINDAKLIGERFFVISRDEKLNDFFKIFNCLKKEINNNDVKFNNKPLGRGEGLIIGISILNSGVPLYKTNDLKQDLYFIYE